MGNSLPVIDLGYKDSLKLVAVSITNGHKSSCAIVTTSSIDLNHLKCWGYAGNGLGYGSTSTIYSAVKDISIVNLVSPDNQNDYSVESVSACERTICVIMSSSLSTTGGVSNLKCFG